MNEIKIPAKDGYLLAARQYIALPESKKSRTLIVNSATAVDMRIYHHYATFMAAQGYDTFIYDYRGIAASRPKKLRGFKADFLDWAQLDFGGVLDYAKRQFPEQAIFVIGHSIGGALIGMMQEAQAVKAVISVGAQTAYYKDWAAAHRQKTYVLWHMVLPVLISLFGYLPGKRLNIMEDFPKGIGKQFHRRRLHPDLRYQLQQENIDSYYEQYTFKLLTLGLEDDPIGTHQAIKRLHDWYEQADKSLEMISPSEMAAEAIGHFGFFKRQFKTTLWQKTLDWYDNQ